MRDELEDSDIENARNEYHKSYGYHIQGTYNLHITEYETMGDLQNWRCAICGKQHNAEKKWGRLQVDHNHKTDKIRGLLCMRCNAALGGFKENSVILASAIRYLRKYRT